MKVKIGSLDTYYKVLDWIFPAYFLIYFVEFYLGLWRLSSIVKLVCILFTFVYLSQIIKKARNNGSFFTLYSVYYLYCIFSVIWYIVNEVPIDCYLNEVYNSLPAMLFVYVGLAEKRSDNQFYEKFSYYCTIALFIGLILYITTPGWFVQRSLEAYESRSFHGSISEGTLMSTMRFCGFFRDVYEADMYAMVALSISLFMFFNKSNSKSEWWAFFMVLINLVAAILTQQRVAMVSSVFAFLFYIVYCSIRGKHRKSRMMIIVTSLLIVVLFSFVVIIAGDRIDQLSFLLEGRLESMSLSGAMDERSNQHVAILNHWTMPIFGKGAGSGSTAAAYYGLPHINDGGYFQVLYEFGIVGFVFFIIIILKTLFRAAQKMRFYLTELVIVCFVLVAMLGSNTLTIGYMLIVPFWYSIGRIWNKEHRLNMIKYNTK